MNGFDKVGGLRSVLCFCERLGVCGEESKAERESRGGEDGESLGEDVGDNLGLEEMRVELVSIKSRRLAHEIHTSRCYRLQCICKSRGLSQRHGRSTLSRGLILSGKEDKNIYPLHHKKVQDYFIREGKGG